jgi:hypothetical protein
MEFKTFGSICQIKFKKYVMNPKALQNNEELFLYLTQLAENLNRCKQAKLSEAILKASRFAIGSESEFMHEAQLALEDVKRVSPKGLSNEELEDLVAVIAQIKKAFENVGGA